MSHHVIVKVPDGRLACADYRQPIVHVMHRILHRVGMSAAEANRKGGSGSPADLADLAIVTEWLDHCPELACPYAISPDDETCGGRHPPAAREHYTPPPYKRPVLDGLW